MLDEKGFDAWSKYYNESVIKSNDLGSYPFVAYDEIIGKIVEFSKKRFEDNKEKSNLCLLDIGFGTANLTKKLYHLGYKVYGIDFSNDMISKAKKLMEDAILIKHDFNYGLPVEFKNKTFDLIILTYSIHHLNYERQALFINELVGHLNNKGKILIGDVMTKNKNDLLNAKKKDKDSWDEDEF